MGLICRHCDSDILETSSQLKLYLERNFKTTIRRPLAKRDSPHDAISLFLCFFDSRRQSPVGRGKAVASERAFAVT